MTAFITRDLPDHSEFKSLLTAAGWEVAGQLLVELSPLPFGPVPEAEWMFFSSQNAVRFYFDNQANAAAPSPERIRWAALGPATARALSEYVEPVDFMGTGEPESTAQSFRLAHPGAGRILFPAARHSRQSVMAFLAPDYECLHFPIYDNRPLANPPHSEADVLVFTSPLNAEAYFSKHPLGSGQQVVAIGDTTGAALRQLGIAGISVAAQPSERGLADAVLKFEI